jgi:hypothetical protein
VRCARLASLVASFLRVRCFASQCAAGIGSAARPCPRVWIADFCSWRLSMSAGVP